MLDIKNLGPRIDSQKATALIAVATGKDKVSRSTLYRWVQAGKFPKPLPNQQSHTTVWATKECLEKLGLDKI